MQDFIPYNQWLHIHDDDIRSAYPDHKTSDIADEIGANYYTVSRRAKKLGVSKTEDFMHSSWVKGARKPGKKTGPKQSEHKEASDAYMREYFSNTPNERLAATFGVDVKTVRRWARRLGLQKSDEFMRKSRSGRKKFYSPEHEEWRRQRIAEVYPDGDLEDLRRLSAELGFSLQGLRALATDMGIHRTKEATHRLRIRGQKYTPQVIADFAEYFPHHSNLECAQRFGMSIHYVSLLAKKHGIKKSEEYQSALTAFRLQNIRRAIGGSKRKKCQQ